VRGHQYLTQPAPVLAVTIPALPDSLCAAGSGAERTKNRIAEIDRLKLLLFENLNHTGVAPFIVLAVHDAIKAFAILR
jgi:hypothetical protein